MKNAGRILAAAMVALAAVGSAAASTMSFEDVRDFSGDGTHAGRDYVEVNDGNSGSFGYCFSHSVAFSPAATRVGSAELVLSHAKNSGDNGEVWLFWSQGGASLGPLSPSNDAWVDQVFFLSDALFSAISGTNWSLTLKLTEGTNGTDRLWLDRSTLRGTYEVGDAAVGVPPTQADEPVNVVPEPRSMILLGSGLLGLAGILRRRGRAA